MDIDLDMPLPPPAADLDGPSDHNSSSNGFPLDRRPKKSSSTCTTCRARKVRCNGARDVCSNCQRLGFPCSYDDVDSGAWSVALPRRRVKQACLSCHSRKARCSGHMPTCERCRVQGIECVYRPSKRSRVVVAGAGIPGASADCGSQSHDGDRDMDDGHDDSDQASSDQASTATPRTNTYLHDTPSPGDSFDALVQRTFGKFFRHVHHIPAYSFLHRASLMEQYNAGKVDKVLLLALVGITSCLTDMGPGMRECGDRSIEEAEALLFADYARPSTIKIQALVFMIKHRILCNRVSGAFILLGLASRYAVALRLNYESPNLCFLARESRRRLMWSLYTLDLTISGGQADYSLWRPEKIAVGLPCNERNFEFDLPQPTERLVQGTGDARPSQAEDIGSLALHVRILYIRQKIIDFTKGVLLSGHVHTGDLQTRVLELHQELDYFASHLPSSFQFSENSLRLRAYSPRICAFVMIHLWWRQCHCDLYRLALVGLRDALPRPTLDSFDESFIQHCQRQCFDHSAAMADIFAALQRLGAKPVADLDFAICAYQCARMLTYALHTNGPKFGLSAESVLAQVHVCERAIRQCCTSPAASSIRGDLDRLVTQSLSPLPSSSSPPPPGGAAAVGAPGGGVNKRARMSHSSTTAPLSRPSLLRDVDAVGTASPASPADPHFPSPPNSFLPPSIISDPWSSENQISADMLRANAVEMGGTGTTGRLPNTDGGSGFGTGTGSGAGLTSPSMLNNAYEGAAYEGDGPDTAFDLSMGMDLNMWISSGGDWMGGTEFLNGNTGVGV